MRTNKLIEETKETIILLRDNLIENYLDNHGKLITNEFNNNQWTEESYQEAIDFANQEIINSIKELKTN